MVTICFLTIIHVYWKHQRNMDTERTRVEIVVTLAAGGQ